MKALTVQQPWAWAIAHGGKTIENRTQMWTYRGPLAIHAGARWSDRGAEADLVHAAWDHAGVKLDAVVAGRLQPWAFDLAAFVAIAELVDVHPDAGCCKPWGESAYVEHGGRERRRITHLVLEDVRALPEPIPCKGALGLWSVPGYLDRQITTQLMGIAQ